MSSRIPVFIAIAAIGSGCSYEISSESDSSPVPVSSNERSQQSDVKVVETTAKGSYHEDATNGYSIFLPEGWGTIDEASLRAQSEALSGPQLKIEYIAGYQKLKKEPFTHPYILVRRLPHAVLPRERMKAVRRNFRNAKDDVRTTIDRDWGLADAGYELNVEVGVPALDPQSGIVWLKSQIDGLDGSRVEVLAAHYYVGDEILQFNAGTTVSRSEADWPVLERILQSIKLEPSQKSDLVSPKP